MFHRIYTSIFGCMSLFSFPTPGSFPHILFHLCLCAHLRHLPVDQRFLSAWEGRMLRVVKHHRRNVDFPMRTKDRARIPFSMYGMYFTVSLLLDVVFRFHSTSCLTSSIMIGIVIRDGIFG